METNNLSLLIDVVRRGSFAAAAKERGVDPSSVSRTISALEDELGLRLFQRSTRRMSLTEAGDLYLARIESILDELERARTEAHNVSAAPTGTLRMTTSVTFGETVVLPLLPRFRAFYPALKVEAIFTDANVDLVAERMDLAIRLAPTIEGDFIAAKLMDTRYRVVASPDYIRRTGPIAEPKDISDRACLLFTLRAFRSRWIFRDGAGAQVEVSVHGDITLSPASALRTAAVEGLGPALLPDWLVDADIAAGRLINVFPNHDVTATTFDTAAWLIYPSRVYLPNKVRVMIDFLRSSI